MRAYVIPNYVSRMITSVCHLEIHLSATVAWSRIPSWQALRRFNWSNLRAVWLPAPRLALPLLSRPTPMQESRRDTSHCGWIWAWARLTSGPALTGRWNWGQGQTLSQLLLNKYISYKRFWMHCAIPWREWRAFYPRTLSRMQGHICCKNWSSWIEQKIRLNS